MSNTIAIEKKGFGIFAKLLSGFAFIVFLTGVGDFYSYIQMNRLADFTTKIYNHPLKVSKAVLSADTSIVKIHRSMKDVALSSNDNELETAIEAVNKYEKEVYEHLGVVKHSILGVKGSLMLNETVKLFKVWKPIRDEVIVLTKAGNQLQAFAITKGKGANHVDMMNGKMEELKVYAANKALGMISDSEDSKRKIINTSSAILLIIIIFSGSLGYLLSRSITKSVKLLVKGMLEFSKGNLEYKVVPNSKDEIGWLANAFNDMAAERKKVVKHIKASLKEKETFLQEIHHRVKNNMAVISSLLNLQMARVTNQKAKEALQESQNRVQTMSKIHETLYRSDSLTTIDMQKYLTELGGTILQIYSCYNRIKLRVESETIMIGVKQASPLGLIVNELVTNSLKYAFPNDRKGEIVLKIISNPENEYELTVSDNGIGLSPEFTLQKADSLGLKLVKTIAEDQLDGSIITDQTNGTAFIIKFRI